MVFFFNFTLSIETRALTHSRSLNIIGLFDSLPLCLAHYRDQKRVEYARTPNKIQIFPLCVSFLNDSVNGVEKIERESEKEWERSSNHFIFFAEIQLKFSVRLHPTNLRRERKKNRRTWESHTSQQHLPKVFFFREFAFINFSAIFFMPRYRVFSFHRRTFSPLSLSLSLFSTSLLLFALLI